jgi:hypothetical protein
MMMYFLTLILSLSAMPVLAQNWDLRGADIPLSQADALALTSNRTLALPDNSLSRFSAGSSFSYTYPDKGGTDFGLFSVERDGRVCIDFDNGRSRCDLFVRNGNLLIMLTEKGERFPIRLQLTLKP